MCLLVFHPIKSPLKRECYSLLASIFSDRVRGRGISQGLGRLAPGHQNELLRRGPEVLAAICGISSSHTHLELRLLENTRNLSVANVCGPC
jgi:hypothetical protein